MVGASNTAGGDDQAGAVLTSEDAPSNVVIWDINNGDTGSIAEIDIAGVGIPRAGGYETNAALPASTSPAINFAKEVSRSNGVTVALIPMAVGGRGVFFGGTPLKSVRGHLGRRARHGTLTIQLEHRRTFPTPCIGR